MISMTLRRGDVYWVDFGPEENGSSVQANKRPAVVVQCDSGNDNSPITIVVAGTTTIKFKQYLCDVIVNNGFFKKPTRIMCNQIFTINKTDLEEKIGTLDSETMIKISEALKFSLGLV